MDALFAVYIRQSFYNKAVSERPGAFRNDLNAAVVCYEADGDGRQMIVADRTRGWIYIEGHQKLTQPFADDPLIFSFPIADVKCGSVLVYGCLGPLKDPWILVWIETK